MKKILLFLSVTFFGQIKAQTWVTIPDPNFVSWLQTTIPSAMSGNQMDASSSAVTSFTTMNVGSAGISDLSGVQYFTSLTHLICDHNSLTSLPILPNSIGWLDCSDNTLTSLTTLPSSLLYFYCYNNSLTVLPTLPGSLIYLRCQNNALTNLPSFPNSLYDLDCSRNYISNLPILDNALTSLYCGYNSLTSLPVFNNALAYLNCDSNYLTALPTFPGTINQVSCNYNSLTTLPTLPNGLQVLLCGANNITCFPVFPNSLINVSIGLNPYNCLPNYILPAMNNYTTTPLCAQGNSNGCPVATGIEQVTLNNIQIKVYPNPTSDQFFIETNTADKLNVDLYDVNGRHVFSASISDKENINIATLDNGAYTLAIKTAGHVINKKLIILR